MVFVGSPKVLRRERERERERERLRLPVGYCRLNNTVWYDNCLVLIHSKCWSESLYLDNYLREAAPSDSPFFVLQHQPPWARNNGHPVITRMQMPWILNTRSHASFKCFLSADYRSQVVNCVHILEEKCFKRWRALKAGAANDFDAKLRASSIEKAFWEAWLWTPGFSTNHGLIQQDAGMTSNDTKRLFCGPIFRNCIDALIH